MFGDRVLGMRHLLLTIFLILFALPSWGQTTFSGGNISGGKISTSKGGTTTNSSNNDINQAENSGQKIQELSTKPELYNLYNIKTSIDSVSKKGLKMRVFFFKDASKNPIFQFSLHGDVEDDNPDGGFQFYGLIFDQKSFLFPANLGSSWEPEIFQLEKTKNLSAFQELYDYLEPEIQILISEACSYLNNKDIIINMISGAFNDGSSYDDRTLLYLKNIDLHLEDIKKLLSSCLKIATKYSMPELIDTNEADVNIRKEFSHEGGNLSAEGTVIEGKKSGYWKYYEEDGKLQNDDFFENGIKQRPKLKSRKIYVVELQEILAQKSKNQIIVNGIWDSNTEKEVKKLFNEFGFIWKGSVNELHIKTFRNKYPPKLSFNSEIKNQYFIGHSLKTGLELKENSVRHCKSERETQLISAPKTKTMSVKQSSLPILNTNITNQHSVKPFAAWNYARYVRDNPKNDYYGLAISGNWRIKPNNNTIQLFSPAWLWINEEDKEYGIWHYKDKHRSFSTNTQYGKFLLHPNRKALDISKAGYVKALIKELEHQINLPKNYHPNSQYHGVMFDWWHDNRPVPWKEKSLKIRSNIVDEIRNKFGSEFLITGNVNWNLDNLAEKMNGVFLELYKSKNSEPYSIIKIQEMIELIKFYEANLLPPKLIALNSWRITSRPEDISERWSQENYQFARLFTAMSSVIPDNGYILYGDNNADYIETEHEHEYYDFFEINLGNSVTEHVELLQGLGFRNFKEGTIVYNSTPNDYIILFENFAVFSPCMDGLFINGNGKVIQN